MKTTLTILLLALTINLSAQSEWTGQDKVKHFTVSSAIPLISIPIMQDIGIEKPYVKAISFSLLVGITKELYDCFKELPPSLAFSVCVWI